MPTVLRFARKRHTRMIRCITFPLAFLVCAGASADLTLQQFLQGVDTAFPKLVAVRLENDFALAKAREKRGAFDPIFSIENDFLRYNSSATPGKARSTSMTETTLEVLDRSGVKVAFGARYNTGAVKQPGSSTGALGEYFAVAKIPILRDRLNNAKSVAERQAILGVPLAQQSIQEARLSLLQKAGEVYWEWVGAGEKLRIAKEVLGLAEARAAYIKRRVEEGANPPIDNEEASAEVFRRQGALEKAERDLQKSEFKIQFFSWSVEGEPATTAPARTLLPSLPEALLVPDDVLKQQRDDAQANRPELLGIAISKDILALDVIQAMNERKPILDLTIGPGVDFGQDAIGLTAKAGIFYSIPLRQNTADGRIRTAQLKVQKLNLEEKQMRVVIDLEVQDAASNLRQAYARLQATIKEVQATRALERGETIRFDRGLSTLFLINQRERGRAEAESRLVDVRVEHEQARLAYLASSATLAPDKTNLTKQEVNR
jgi:outer membrane protein TolC